MNKYSYIYKFDAKILLEGEHDYDNHIIRCSYTLCELASTVVKKSDSLLFSQIRRNNSKHQKMEDLICIIDFSNFYKSGNKFNEKKLANELKHFENGFELMINSIDKDGSTIFDKHTIVFKDFLKSNSMSKESQVYYLNSEEHFSEKMRKICYLGFDEKEEVAISKLYAYSGLVCSDVTVLDDVNFNEDEFVVVNDIEDDNVIASECIIGISEQSLYENIKTNSELDKKKIACYKEALPYLETHNADVDTIKEMISDYYSLPNNVVIEKYSYIGTNSTGEVVWKQIRVENYPVVVNLFDGEGLIEFSYFQNEIVPLLKPKYRSMTSIQIRMPYCKGMLHSCDFITFFKEQGVESIIDIDGIAHKIDNVKIILTESMFKCINFIDKNLTSRVKWYLDTINKYKFSFGVVTRRNREKEYVNLQYEFLATLPLKGDDVKYFITNSNDVFNKKCSENSIVEKLKDGDEIERFQYELCQTEKGKKYFLSTSSFQKNRKDEFDSLKIDAKFSRFPVMGTQKYLSGDILEFLYKICGRDIPSSEKLDNGSFYMPGESWDNDNAVILRSPHYSRNEVTYSEKAKIGEIRNKYLSHLNSVLMFDSRSLNPARLSGADFDGDLVLAISEETIVNNCQDIMSNYPTILIPSLKARSYKFVFLNKLHCFDDTFSSRTGRISNDALYDLTVVYNSLNSDLDRIGFYTVLNGLEIDSAKNGQKPFLPELPVDKDSLIEQFIEAKNEKNKSRNYKKDSIASLDQKAAEKTDYFASNILNAYKFTNEIIQLDLIPKTNNKFVRTIDSEACAKICAISDIYKQANHIISRVLSSKGRTYIKNLAVSSMMTIDQIISKQNIDIEDLITSFDINSNEAYRYLEKYVNDNKKKFHFLKTKEEKEEYIKDFGVTLKQSTIDILTMEDNENYRLLYLILLNLSKRTNVIVFNDNSVNKDIKNSQWYDAYNSFFTTIKKSAEETTTKFINYDSNKIANEVYEKLIEFSNEFTWEQISKVIDIYNDDIVFTIFKNQLSKHFMEER